MQNVSNSEDILDSRDVIARIEELQSDGEDGTADDDDKDELKELLDLASEGEGCPDWQYGEALIRDSYFKEYAMELAEDIGAINHEAGWPNTCIDWDQAARDLQMDYTALEFGGVTYWARA